MIYRAEMLRSVVCCFFFYLILFFFFYHSLFLRVTKCGSVVKASLNKKCAFLILSCQCFFFFFTSSIKSTLKIFFVINNGRVIKSKNPFFSKTRTIKLLIFEKLSKRNKTKKYIHYILQEKKNRWKNALLEEGVCISEFSLAQSRLN